MPVKVDDQISRSVMFLCLGTAVVLVVAQWGLSNSPLMPKPQHVGIIRANRQASPKVPAPAATSAPAPSPSPSLSPQTDVRIVVQLGDRTLVLYKGQTKQAEYPIAVAQKGWETPTGTFQVLDMEKNPTWIHPITGEEVPPGADNPLGVAWIGFWTDGESEIGLHGTNQEELIGSAVSHGCLRMRNADIKTIYAQVSAGTPIEVKP